MMPLSVILNAEGAWPEFADKPPTEGRLVAVAGLASGMASGKPSVALRIEVEGREEVIIAQTSLALLLTAVRALATHHGDPTVDDWEGGPSQ